MARMRTNSASYFPMDVGYFNDRKIRRLRKECLDIGVIVHLNLLCSIYADRRGYCTEADENLIFDISERFDIGEQEVIKILNTILDIGLFDKVLYHKFHIITAKAVQLRFQEIVKKKALKTPVSVEGRYWLLDETETQRFIRVTNSEKKEDFSTKNNVNSAKNDVNSRKNTLNSTKNAVNKIKEKEIKENKIKEEERKEEKADESAAAAGLITEYEKFIGKATNGVREGIEKYLRGGMEPKLISRLIQYALEQGKCSWQYIEAAIEGNIAEGIRTLDKYKKSREKRATKRKGKGRGINNYTDSNKPDYSDMSDKIIREMLEEAVEKGYGD